MNARLAPRRRGLALTGIVALLAALTITAATPVLGEDAAATVRAREHAFADTLAERDLATFRTFLSEETVFWAGEEVDRGKAAVAARWAAFFEGPDAPFSWRPEQVAALDSGEIAFSSGPVFDPEGRRVATFHSVWRLEADGEWRIIFDKGARHCPPPEPK